MPHSHLPPGAEKYAESPIFSEGTVPAKLLDEHSTKSGVWGRIRVLSGRLLYVIPGEPQREQELDEATPGVIVPEEIHYVRPLGAVSFQVEFYR